MNQPKDYIGISLRRDPDHLMLIVDGRAGVLPLTPKQMREMAAALVAQAEYSEQRAKPSASDSEIQRAVTKSLTAYCN